MLEVSSAGVLTYGGQATATASSGQQGRLLLDPKNLIISSGVGLPQFNLVNPNPDRVDTFGANIVVLTNGNVVVTDPTAGQAGLNNTGAVFLYNGQTGALLGTLYRLHQQRSAGQRRRDGFAQRQLRRQQPWLAK